MQPYVDDTDFQLYVGDALETLREFPDESVDCVVTSPPYWGLRDYGTGEWEGGDENCDHKQGRDGAGRADGIVDDRAQRNRDGAAALTRQECRCGARRIDQQLGLEPTPDAYVTRMVEVFREVRRVLAGHGTCWVNLGDSYASGNKGGPWDEERTQFKTGAHLYSQQANRQAVDGLKPKDLVGIPWRVAFALQADGWYLRSDIIWSKPNPMPESVTDRPTKAHEYVFLLTKQPRYWFDQEAVREKYQPSTIERDAYGYNHAFRNQFQGSPSDERHQDGKQLPPGSFAKGPDGRRKTTVQGADGSIQHRDGERWPNGGRNIRSVWEIATQPYPEAHFATFPEELARRCILAGCPERVCRVCGKPSERLLERQPLVLKEPAVPIRERRGDDVNDKRTALSGTQLVPASAKTIGWSDCGCLLSEREDSREGDGFRANSANSRSESKWRPGVVLDPFLGSGTTALVARNHNRHAIGIELSAEYAELAAKRTRQLSLLA